MTGVSCQSLLQLVVADAYRGRVLSLWTMAGFGGAVLGTLGLGAMGDRFGLAPSLVLLGLGGLIAFVAIGITDRYPRWFASARAQGTAACDSDTQCPKPSASILTNLPFSKRSSRTSRRGPKS